MMKVQDAAKFFRSVLAATALAAGMAVSTQAGPYSATIGKFDFTYLIQGDDFRIKPLQVFDDGERTYFQFRSDAPIPAILDATGQKVFTPYKEGPYIVVNGRPRDFVLALGLSRATAVHADVASGAQPRPDVGRAPAGPAMISTRYTQPARYDAGDATASSYAAPVRGDVVEWQEQGRTQDQPVLFAKGSATLSKAARDGIESLARRIDADTKIVVIGRDDPSQKDGLAEQRALALRNALTGAGVPRDSIRLQIGVEFGDPIKSGKSYLYASSLRWTQSRALRDVAQERPAGQVAAAARAVSPAQRFDIRAADYELAVSLQRWASNTGYELVWDAEPVKVDGASMVEANDMVDAVKKVVGELRRMGYPVKAQAYSDRVIRITKG